MTLEQLGQLVERGFSAIASDIKELRADVNDIKDEIAEMRQEMRGVTDRLSAIESEVRDIRQRLEHVGNMRGFSKEIDYLNDRLRRIERHLGLEQSIAA